MEKLLVTLALGVRGAARRPIDGDADTGAAPGTPDARRDDAADAADDGVDPKEVTRDRAAR